MQTNQLQNTASGYRWEDISPASSITSSMPSAEACSSAKSRDLSTNKIHFDNEEKENAPLQITSNLYLNLNHVARADTTKVCQQPSRNQADAGILFAPSLPFPLTPPQTLIRNPGKNFSLQDSIPDLPRQTSLNVVLEVLGSTPDTGHILEGFYPPTPSPSDNQDEHYFQHPSPCSMATRHRATSEMQTDLPQLHFPTNDPRLRAHSADQAQNEEKKAVFYFYDDTAKQCDANETSTESSTSTESPNDSKSTEASCSSSNTVTSSNAQLENAPPLQSLSSFIIKSIDNSVEPESMDVDGILQDFLDSTSSQKSQSNEVIRSKLLVEADHCYSAKRITITDAIATSASSASEMSPSPATTPTTAVAKSTPKMVRTPSYIKRRTENNLACRESRRKRKAEREEAEEKLKFFLKDNEEQKEKIKQLEVEVKKTRALLLNRMTNQH